MNDLAQNFWVGPVLHRSCKSYHNNILHALYDLDRDLCDVWSGTWRSKSRIRPTTPKINQNNVATAGANIDHIMVQKGLVWAREREDSGRKAPVCALVFAQSTQHPRSDSSQRDFPQDVRVRNLRGAERLCVHSCCTVNQAAAFRFNKEGMYQMYHPDVTDTSYH